MIALDAAGNQYLVYAGRARSNEQGQCARRITRAVHRNMQSQCARRGLASLLATMLPFCDLMRSLQTFVASL